MDGLLREVERLPKWATGPVVSRIKVLSNLDIAEKRVPQDGRFKVEIAQRPIELRVSTLPTTYGEKVVIRIIDQYRTPADLLTLGLQQSDLGAARAFRTEVDAPRREVEVEDAAFVTRR